MRLFLIGIALLAVSGSALGHDDPAGCFRTAGTQSELNHCARGNYHGADAEMNRLYRELEEKGKDDAKFLSALQEAQRAWVHFRDAQLAMKFPHRQEAGFYGSSQPMCETDYLAELTARRIAELREWIKGAAEGDVCAGSMPSTP